jgi:hypothetical protein
MSDRQSILFNDLTQCYFEVMDDSGDYQHYTDKFRHFVGRCRLIIGSLTDDGVRPVYGRWVFPVDINKWINHVSVIARHLDSHKYVDKNVVSFLGSVRDKVFDCNPILGEMLKELILKLSFDPANVRKNNVKGVVQFPKIGMNKDPGVSSIVISALAAVDAKYTYTFPVMSGYIYDYEHGIANRYMAGNSYVGYLTTLNKMGANIVEPRESGILAPLLHVADDLMYKMGIEWREPRQMDFSKENIYRMLKDLDSSSGWYNDVITRYNSQGITNPLKVRKKNLAYEVHKLVWRLLFEIEEYVAGRGPEPNFNMFAQESRKWEFRTVNMMSKKVTAEDAEAQILKERLFYIDTILAYVLGKEFFKDFAFMLTSYQSMIGIKVEAGGLQMLWDYTTGSGKSPLKKRWEKVYLHVSRKFGVDLRQRRYSKGDWSKFDQTLLAKVLAVMACLCVPFVSKPDGMSDAAYKYLLVVIVCEVVYKTMYIYSTDSLYDVWGSMFSGKYVTSIGDTVYQMLIRGCYVLFIYLKYARANEIVKLIIENMMMTQGYYGDDNIGGWPAYMDDFLMYDDADNSAQDFVFMCERIFGMVNKWQEFDVYDECYSTHCFEEANGQILLTQYYDGPSFIRNQVSHIYLDGVFLGDFPYRSTEDIMAKVGRVLTASRSVAYTMCLVCSLARLCSGNLEAYDQLSKVYYELLKVNGRVTADQWNSYKKVKHSNSITRMLLLYGDYDGVNLFPSLVELHNNQIDGYQMGVGLNPSVDGVIFDSYNLVNNTGKPLGTIVDIDISAASIVNDKDFQYFTRRSVA